ncbi:hypothetical protein IG631_14026 [Alternaria alternata]|nr:hypothetical protein IG631_14026 [Alternaria alternata]
MARPGTWPLWSARRTGSRRRPHPLRCSPWQHVSAMADLAGPTSRHRLCLPASQRRLLTWFRFACRRCRRRSTA